MLLAYISYTWMCRPDGLFFHEKSLDMGPLFRGKPIDMGPFFQHVKNFGFHPKFLKFLGHANTRKIRKIGLYFEKNP